MQYIMAAVLVLTGCSRAPKPNPGLPGPHIYLSGFTGNNAVYWIDHTMISLDLATNATGITVVGKDVYVCGNRGFAYQGGGADRACYWNNGTRVDMSDPPSYANGIAVSGNDIYVVGSALINNDYVAVYWKNGTATPLSTVNNSLANGITISGSDVYIAGFDGQGACYWKNGVKTMLENDPSANAWAVTIDGSDVYVTGNIYTQWLHRKAAYWKNGSLTRLETGKNDSMVVDTYANGIGVDGSDVHVSGWINAYDAVYWKNGAMKRLYNPDTYVNIAHNTGNLFMFNHSPYISLNSSDYWYNDTVRHVGNGYGTGIFVSGQ